MSRMLISLAIAATVVAGPTLASAQPDVRQDRQETRQDRRELNQDRNRAAADGRVTPGERRGLSIDRREVRQDQNATRFDRNNRNWWRGRTEFRDYAGPRAGFWYAPGRGYYQVDPRFYGQRWAVGAVAPALFRGYSVSDPGIYGVGPAGYGRRWIYLGSNLALINVRTGRIVTLVPDVF